MKNRYLFVALSYLLSTFLGSDLPAQCPEIVWADEFDGTSLDLSKWSYQIGDGCPGLCSWGNNELQFYRQENAVVGGGMLSITAKKENYSGKAYTSARLRSIQKGDFTYGRFEARIKLPAGQGLWPAFWMLSTDEPYGGWPQSGEIDIMELIGREPATAHGTLHYGQLWPNNKSTTASYTLAEGIFNDDFHVFALEWEPNEIRWYVDDFLYSTKKAAEVAPNKWPFDQDFHFLLNLAVGGNWPGNPDGSTVFPQSMIVDYLRVYKMVDFPFISGKRAVASQAESETYTLENLPENTSVNWSVPAGATITSGQGTSQISVNWGTESGILTAGVSSTCFSKDYQLAVLVQPALALEFNLENFDDEARINYTSSTGNLQEVNNPMGNSVNASTLVGKYVRNATAQYDVLVYSTQAISNATPFITGQKKYFLDVRTDAPPGTQILLQMENKSRSGQDYPIGRNSRFQTFTTKQNEWERLEFTLLDQPDPGTSNLSINQLTFLFASNTFTGKTYFFDNFAIYSQVSSPVKTQNFSASPELKVFPNPGTGVLNLQNLGTKNYSRVFVYDIKGQTILTQELPLGGRDQQKLDLESLTNGTYFLRLISDKSGAVAWARFMITK